MFVLHCKGTAGLQIILTFVNNNVNPKVKSCINCTDVSYMFVSKLCEILTLVW